nr:amyloid fibril protein=immunoglobulin lambda light chain homolog (peptide D6) [horses, Peptide Partial, 12 aa] [Equidae]
DGVQTTRSSKQS